MDKSLVYLAQTDTTVGFLSLDDKKLSAIKQRNPDQKTLQVVDKFKTLKQFVRVPKNKRKLVRNSKKTTFIYPNKEGYRVVDKDDHHQNFLKKVKCLYSTSANITKEKFDNTFAIDKSDIIIHNNKCFDEKNSSSIYTITQTKIVRMR